MFTSRDPRIFRIIIISIDFSTKANHCAPLGSETCVEIVRKYSAKNTENVTFYTGLPYGTNAAFGYTTLIDSMQELKNEVAKVSLGQTSASDEEFGMNRAETKSLQYLIDGKIVK